MKAFVWMSFDLGVRGDYEGMYEFLDAHRAKECGDSIGVFSYEYKKDLVGELLKELKEDVDFDKRSRVYLIYPSKKGPCTGKFIVGKRKSPPWTGYGPSQEDEEDSGE